jgi:hypothetical protein
MQIETVKIKHEDGYAIINRCDFDGDQHELFEEKAEAEAEAPAEKKVVAKKAAK